jgi:hypothetical protein
MDANLACYTEEIQQSTNFRNKVLRAAERRTKEDQTRNEGIRQLLQIFLTLDKKKLHRAKAARQPYPYAAVEVRFGRETSKSRPGKQQTEVERESKRLSVELMVDGRITE